MLEEEYLAGHRPFGAQRTPPPLEVPFDFAIRAAETADLPDVRGIYNHYVANTVVTFDERPASLADLRAKHAQAARLGLPFLVAVTPAAQVIGYAHALPYRSRAAYRRTAEVSIYLGPAATGKGLGTALMTRLVEESRAAGLRELVAVVADGGAEASVRLHEAAGFRRIGQMGRVGFKFGRWLGTILLQKSLR